ncbi:MAG: hypothetical protein MPJ50_07850 [Pirellulales bacterium]|nr:hypothetical protein [Pirellulales bacterium]
MSKRELHRAADVSRLRRNQIVSFAIAIVVGGLIGGGLGGMLDHVAAEGNAVSQIISPILGPDVMLTIASCSYFGIVAALVFAFAINRLLQFRARRAVARVASREMLRLLEDSQIPKS